MKRRDILKSGLVLAGTTALAAPAIAQSAPTIRWRLTSSFPKSLDTIYGGGEFFAERVSKLTDGKFNIRVFAAGDIVPAFQALDAVQQGTVEMCHTATYYYVGKDFTFGFGTALPFGLTTRQQNAWMYHGGGIDTLNDFFKEYGVIALPGRQHRGADGRLVQKGGEHARRLQGAEDAHPRPRRPGDGAHRRGAAEHCPAATSIRRWSAAPSTPPNGSAPTTTRSSASTRSPSTTTTRAGGSRARCTTS